MLAAARAFDGEDGAEVIAAVVKTTPDWTALPADVPAPIVALIRRCLEKDRRRALATWRTRDSSWPSVRHSAPNHRCRLPRALRRATPARALPWMVAAALAADRGSGRAVGAVAHGARTGPRGV